MPANWLFELESTLGGRLAVPEPLGWAGAVLTLRRGPEHGLFDLRCSDLGFVGAGYALLWAAFAAEWGGAVVTLYISQRTGSAYTLCYTAELEVNGFEAGLIARCTPVEGGTLRLLRRRWGTAVNLIGGLTIGGKPLTSDPTGTGRTLQLDPKNITQQSRFAKTGGLLLSPAAPEVWQLPAGPGTTTVSSTYTLQPGYDLVLEDGATAVHHALSQNQTTALSEAAPRPYFTFTDYADYRLQLAFDFSGTVSALSDALLYASGLGNDYDGSQVSLVMALAGVETVLYSSQYLRTAPPGLHTFTGHAGINTAFSTEPGQRLSVFFRIRAEGKYSNDAFDDHTVSFLPQISLSNVAPMVLTRYNLTPTSYAAGLLPAEAFTRSVEAMTENAWQLKSDYLGRANDAAADPSLPYTPAVTGPAALTALTTGSLLRGKGKRLEISFKELLAGYAAVYCLGCGPEAGGGATVLRVEPARYFYDETTVVLQLEIADPSAANYRYTLQPELARFHCGYTHWQAPGAGDEYNTPRTYTTGNDNINAQAEVFATTGFIAGGYLLEQLRSRSALTTPQEADAYDAAFCLLETRHMADSRTPGSYVEQAVQGVAQGSGLQDAATVSNWGLSPWAIVQRWWQWLGGMLHSPAAAVLTPEIGAGNLAATGAAPAPTTYTLRGETFAEPAALHSEGDALAQLTARRDAPGRRLLQPCLSPGRIEGTVPLGWDAFARVVAAPTGLIRLQLPQGRYADGFVQEIRFEPTQGLATLVLLHYREV